MEEVLSQKGFAARTGFPVTTIQTYRKRGWLPEPDLMVDNKPLWKASSVDAWVEGRKSGGLVHATFN